MKVLVIGGSGHVGTLVLPYLKAKHDITVFDLKAPADSSLPYLPGSVTDYDTLRTACDGQEVLLYMAMGQMQHQSIYTTADAFDVNIKGVYLALYAAHQAGIEHAVYTSSMSVYQGNLEARGFSDEDLPPDSRHPYGLTKRMGEEVCRNMYQVNAMSVNALRLCFPVDDEEWQKRAKSGATLATRADDVGNILLAALEYRNGFQAFMVSGDYENRFMNMSKAKRVLGWEPLARPTSA
jgi:nucleoside-diphosphate-sugar epimerase